MSLLPIRDVFTPELCRLLVEGLERHGGKVTGYMKDENGRSVEKIDPAVKRRVDWHVGDPFLLGFIKQAIIGKIAPRMGRGFLVERFMVSRYAEGGFFRPHRDNTERATSHRQIACSINLNEDYEGGELRFPDLSDALYRPPLGAAILFPCSLVHEALPVKSGTRYVFPTFFYDREHAKLRQQVADSWCHVVAGVK